MKTPHLTWLAAFGLLASAAISMARDAPPLTAAVSIEIPGSTGTFDFLRVDTKRNRLLAAHEKAGTADYFDLQANKLLTRLKVGPAVDMAVDSDSNFYYVSVQDAERVGVIDAATLQEVASITTAGPTDAIIFEPKNQRVYVTHDDGTHIWVIDPATRKIVATVTLPGKPESMVYDASTDRIYLNIKDKDVVAVIDPSSNKVVGQWPTTPAVHPHGMALDEARHRVFSAGVNGKLITIDTRTGVTTGVVAIARGVDQIAFDTSAQMVYCAGAGQMSVVRTSGDTPILVGNVTTSATARNVAVDPNTHAVWSTFTDGKSSFAKSWMAPGAR